MTRRQLKARSARPPGSSGKPHSGMVAVIAAGRPLAVVRGALAWIVGRIEELTDWMHAVGDAFARDACWSVSRTGGRFGFGGRTYRDPRFGQIRAAAVGRNLTGTNSRPVVVVLGAYPNVAATEGSVAVTGLVAAAAMSEGWDRDARVG